MIKCCGNRNDSSLKGLDRKLLQKFQCPEWLLRFWVPLGQHRAPLFQPLAHRQLKHQLLCLLLLKQGKPAWQSSEGTTVEVSRLTFSQLPASYFQTFRNVLMKTCCGCGSGSGQELETSTAWTPSQHQSNRTMSRRCEGSSNQKWRGRFTTRKFVRCFKLRSDLNRVNV